MSQALPYLDGARIAELMPPAAGVSVLERRLVDHSIDPEQDSPRLFSPLPAGEVLLMPTQAIGYAGVKVVTITLESRASAMREAGNLIPARSTEEWARTPLTNLAELVAGRLQRRLGHPCLYSGVGMAWQDIAIAVHLYTARTEALTGAAAPSLQAS